MGVAAGGELMVPEAPGGDGDGAPLIVVLPIPEGSTRALSFRVGEVVGDAVGDWGWG